MRFIIIALIPIVSSLCHGQQDKSPKLVVGIVIDQMCYEYLYRYNNKFSENGFKKLMSEGTNCRNTQYNYVPTYTGPGHASIYTGTTPSNHGIVANDWFDRSTNNSINCVDDSTVTSVGTTSSFGNFSPKNLKVNTITDQLKMTYPEAKVISISIKNRGAILPGGHLSDGSYWYDFSSGKFITSSFFKKNLPSWVANFNDKKQVEQFMDKEWNTLLPIENYVESGPDDSPYEHLLPGKLSPTFPYNLKEMTGDQTNYELFTYTPFANTYLTSFALQSISNESLGGDSQTDILCISYSTPDMAGHAFGPYSVELEDIYIRLDLEIERLIKKLEEKVGKNEFTIFLTGDHAVVPVPQYLIDKKLPGGYFFTDKLEIALRNSCVNFFGSDYIQSVVNNNIYLDHKHIFLDKIKKEDVSQFIAKEIVKFENIKRVFTGNQLYNSVVDDEWMAMVKKGYHHGESGDVIYILEPGYLPKSTDTESSRKGTSHGSAYSYDTHVPLLWYGKDIPKQEIYRRIDITDFSNIGTYFILTNAECNNWSCN